MPSAIFCMGTGPFSSSAMEMSPSGNACRESGNEGAALGSVQQSLPYVCVG